MMGNIDPRTGMPGRPKQNPYIGNQNRKKVRKKKKKK